MRSHPLGLDVWCLVGPFVYFHTSCVRTTKALARLRGCAVSPEPSLFAYAISTIISWAGSILKIEVMKAHLATVMPELPYASLLTQIILIQIHFSFSGIDKIKLKQSNALDTLYSVANANLPTHFLFALLCLTISVTQEDDHISWNVRTIFSRSVSGRGRLFVPDQCYNPGSWHRRTDD